MRKLSMRYVETNNTTHEEYEPLSFPNRFHVYVVTVVDGKRYAESAGFRTLKRGESLPCSYCQQDCQVGVNIAPNRKNKMVCETCIRK